ncbi:MAG TPA: DNA-3-methyladenine glycosylase I [Solirubrobacteraceae bacterium]|jgi:DNA-3-methyladenine glycosylase I|nr:DNA-3-methyladenine glycosylase I [Solirubrobacteraceae bacterium]
MSPPADDPLPNSGGVTVGEDGVGRCPWAIGDELMRDYHDREWGVPLRGERALYERLTLEAFQSGLSWRTILRKRPAFRAAFADFDPGAVAAFGERDVERLLADAGIVRNRAKVLAAIGNARATVALRPDGGLDELIAAHRPEPGPPPRTLADLPAQTAGSRALAKALKAQGFVFVGPTTAYALMQAVGLVDDHLLGCHRRGAA